jgi:hypothetical protein
VTGKVKAGMRLIREASRWLSFREFCRGIPDSGLQLSRLDYLPPDYVTLLGATAQIAPPPCGAIPGAGWRTDPLSGHCYGKAPAFLTKLRYGRGSDPKAVWENCSFRSAVRNAALRPGDAAAFETWADQIGDWARDNPPGTGINWLSPMECSRRAVNLVLASSFWWPLLIADEGLNSWLARLVVEHAEFVSRNPEIKPGGLTTNHTTANYCGLLTCARAVPRYKGSPGWIDQASAGLESCIARQVRRDGMAFEGSIPYSFYVLDAFAHGALLLRKVGIAPSARYLDLLRGLFRFVLDAADSRGNLPGIGDDDSGEWLTPRTAYMPAMMSALFASIFGVHPGPRATATARGESGVSTLRRGDLEAVVAAFPVGQEGLGGHNHEDLLQFCFSFMGLPVVVDPGSGSYSRDLEQRSLLRSMHSHNGPIPDGADHYYTFPKGAPFDLRASREFRTSIEARDKGGRRGAVLKVELDGRTLVRMVVLTEDALEVADFMLAGGQRSPDFSVRLTLDPAWAVRRGEGNLILLTCGDAALEFESNVPVEVGKGICSPGYDRVVETSVLTLHAGSPEGLSFRFGSESGRASEG